MNEIDAIDWQLLGLLQNNAAQGNQQLADQVHVSAPTCQRRVKRLEKAGLIEKQVAVLDPQRIAEHRGHGLTAIVEVSLETQGEEHLALFEQSAVQETAVQQCYRVSPGPDFVLIVCALDMPDYLGLTQRLFTSDRNVREGFFQR
jgi:Lrp/AsnC family transcriptional regulator, leucine-responsive regulatory protein